MSFRKNDSQQMTLFDNALFGLTAREQKALERSWAKVFAEDVFPSIDESRFSVLYSDKGSRPNTPVNVIVGALLIKELFDLSDDDVVENLLLDPRYQYALHTTSFEEQPLSDKSLTRFRQRCYDYERTHGIDLYHDCIKDLAGKTAKLMKIDGRIRRMDSLMVEANIRKLSRMELLYRCISKLVVWLHNNGHDDLIIEMEHYYDPNDFNSVIYHCRGNDVSDRMEMLLHDAESLLEKCGSQFQDVTECQLFVRCLSEQTVLEDGKRRMATKEDGTMTAKNLQNPSDPDATFRTKAGKDHRGYVANVEESVSENGSVVTDYAFEDNTKSDSAMLKDHLDKMEPQEEQVTLVTDGAYSGTENQEKADQKNVNLITTGLSGKDVPEIVGEFQLNEDGTRVLQCPAGNVPKSSGYIKQSKSCTASFAREFCESCPHKNECHAKIFKRVAKIKVTKKAVTRAHLQAKMKTDVYKDYGRFRNGVETIPSILRNVFHTDRMPVRGKLRSKFFFGSKIGALNFRKLFRYRKGLGDYAQNPIFA
jgi:hypothetical protein